jgi:hypothetical protein
MSEKKLSIFPDVEIHEDLHCRGCGRGISSEKSVERGHGPTCWIKHLEEMITKEPEDGPELPQQLPKRRKKAKG